MKNFTRSIFSLENISSITEHLVTNGGQVGSGAFGALSSMSFTFIDFFSKQENTTDFATGLNAIGQSGVQSEKTGGGMMGKPQGMSVEEFESYF